MPKLNLTPDQASYSFTKATEVIAIKLEGGASRYRKDVEGAWDLVNVQWQLTRADYDYLMAFYRSAIDKGALPFDIDLLLDGSEIVEHRCYLVPSTFGLRNTQGFSYIVGAQLEVKPNAANSDFDSIFVELMETYLTTDALSSIILNIEEIANIDLDFT